MSARLTLAAGAKSEQGRRSSNDDCLLVDPEAGVYVVCDGARGRFGGRTAGELAVEAIRAALGELRRAEAAEAERAAETALLGAHRRILAAHEQDPSLEGMTSTAAMVLQRGPQALVSWVGDTRVYRLRHGELELLTLDHNLENYLRQNPRVRPKMNVSGKTLVRALGLKTAQLSVEHKRVALERGDVLLINTDGLSDSVPEQTIRELLATVPRQSEEAAAEALTRSAVNHGGMDNVSVIVLHAAAETPEEPSAKHVVLGWLAFLDGPRRVVPLEASTLIGADPGCKIALREDHVSARHAEVVRTEHGFQVRDLGSTNGTFINNVQVKEAWLVDGDMLRVGRRELVFKCHRIEGP